MPFNSQRSALTFISGNPKSPSTDVWYNTGEPPHQDIPFEDSDVHVLDREDRWFERGVKEAIYVHLEQPSLNKGGGVTQHLSATCKPLEPSPGGLTPINTWGHVIPRCPMKPGLRGKYSQMIDPWTHLTLTRDPMKTALQANCLQPKSYRVKKLTN